MARTKYQPSEIESKWQARWAEEDLRSLNGQIEFILRQALAKRGVKLTGETTGEAPTKAEN